ncbi:MAG: nucleotidyltransferase family protein [Alistipes sp.]|nr:nucleotidyltransferase family protein [Alistipes sp.]
MDRVEALTVDICRAYVTGDSASADFSQLDAQSWARLCDACAAHGLTAIGYAVAGEALAANAQARSVKLRWALSAERVTARYLRQHALADEVGRLLSAAGIDAVVFKGFALSRYYRSPEHREQGDIDIYTGRDMERGSAVLAAAGARIEAVTLKNTHIIYKGLMIENHRSTTDARGRRDNREFESLMRRLLRSGEGCECAEGVHVSLPPVMFTALHTLRHALHHYLWEGIALRHLLDWALLVEAEQERIDWPQFYALCERYRLRRFADALTAIAVDRFGVRLRQGGITRDPLLGDRILSDVAADRRFADRNRRRTRLSTVRCFIRGRWKFRRICGRGFLAEMFYVAKGALFERRLKV